MPSDETLSIIVKLQDQASAGLEAMANKVQGLGSDMATSMQTAGQKMSDLGNSMMSVGSKMTGLGTQMSVGLTVPIVALGKTVIDTSMKFQASMELIRTQAGASQVEVTNLTKAVLDLAKSGETGQGPQALADGLYHLESLGLRGAQAMDTLKISAQGADIGLADMEGVTNALGAAMVTGIKGTEDAKTAMGLLDATIGQGNMRMDDLVAAMGTGILPAAKNFGMSLQDVGAALATLTDNGMRADESATRLRMTFSLMAAPSNKAADALGSIGLASDQLAKDMRSGGIIEAVSDLKTHLEGAGLTAVQQSQVLSQAFGGGRSSAAIMTLVEQLDRLKTKYDQIGTSAGQFDSKLGDTADTTNFKMNVAMAKMQAIFIDLGNTVLPIFVDVLGKVGSILSAFASWWDKLNPGVQSFLVKALAVVAILGPLLIILGTIVSTVGALFTAIGGLTTAFGVIAGVIGVTGGIILAIIAGLILIITEWIAIGDLLMNHWTEVWAGIKIMFKEGVNFLIGLAEGWANGWVNAANVIIKALNAIHFSIPDWVPGIGGKSFGINIPTVPAITLPRMEMGGTVPGVRGQEVPMILHGGEEVIPAERAGGRGGQTISITINNPQIRSRSDMQMMADQIERTMRPLFMNAKVVHA
jgi:TP901 family phage tail tape measure protein